MAFHKRSVELEPIDSLGALMRARRSVEVTHARYAAPHLAEQLPYSHRNYANPIRSWQRLGYIDELSRSHKMAGFLVLHHEQVAGVASVVPARMPVGVKSIPSEWDMNPRTTQGYELDYWLRQTPGMVDLYADIDVVSGLTEAAHQLAGDQGVEKGLVWSLTDATDQLRLGAMATNKLRPVGSPAVYNTGDKCTGLRQLHGMPMEVVTGGL